MQANSFGPIVDGTDVVIADGSGTGKTYAYLVPIVDKLLSVEEEEGPTPPGEVRAIILVPTNELAQQVLAAARSLARNGAKFRSSKWVEAGTPK